MKLLLLRYKNIIFIMSKVEEIGKELIKDIRKDLEQIYPKLKEYLERNQPNLLALYEDYYQKAMYNPDPFIASEYAYRIFRAYVSLKTSK
jgi:hypothetical protein